MLLVSSHHGGDVVACACERAEAAGVRAGMTVAHARSLLCGREIVVEPHTPDEDARQLCRLAQWALRFSPIAAPDAPDGLLLDIAGCSHLFGGEARLAERAVESLEQLGFGARIAVAPTFACAQAVARFADRRITIVADGAERAAVAPLPLAALRVEEATCTVLAEVGVERIGQLINLPRAELAARFGDELLRRMDEALGRGAGTVIEAVRPCGPVEVFREFDGPVTCLEAVEAASRELLSLFVQQMDRQESGVCVLTFAFRRIDAGPVAMTLRLTYPSRDEAHLWTLLRPRLERLHLGYGVEEIRLRAVRTERMGHKQIELWPSGLSEGLYVNALASPPEKGGCCPVAGASGSDGPVACARGSDGKSRDLPSVAAWGRLLDEFIERFGPEGVSIVTLSETYVPEDAFVLRPWVWRVEGGGTQRGTGFHPLKADGTWDRLSGGRHAARRPTRLFSRPEPARAMTLTPDGPLVWIRWRGRDRAVRRCVGPERIALPWWSAHSQEILTAGQGTCPTTALAVGYRCVTRDYYALEDEHDDWLWVFRDRMTGQWFVHGEWV